MKTIISSIIFLFVILGFNGCGGIPTEKGVYVKTKDGNYEQLLSMFDGEASVWVANKAKRYGNAKIKDGYWDVKSYNFWYSANDTKASNIFKVRVKQEDFDSLIFVDIPKLKDLSLHKAYICSNSIEELDKVKLRHKKIRDTVKNKRSFGLYDVGIDLAKIEHCYSKDTNKIFSVFYKKRKLKFNKRELGKSTYSIKGLESKFKYVARIDDDLWWFEIY